MPCDQVLYVRRGAGLTLFGMTSITSERLSRVDSLDVLALGNLGRLIFSGNALHVPVPARYVVDHERVLVHVVPMTNTVLWRDGDVVTLHVSVFEQDQGRGWSVSVTGPVHGTPDLGLGGERPTAPWIASGGGDLLEIATEVVEGERLECLRDDDAVAREP
jgi:hypothetical protein